MKQGTSTITTTFTAEAGGRVYTYDVTQQAGKAPYSIIYRVMQDNRTLVTGSNRPADGYFGFETQSGLTGAERAEINSRINGDLETVIALASNINVTTESNGTDTAG